MPVTALKPFGRFCYIATIDKLARTYLAFFERTTSMIRLGVPAGAHIRYKSDSQSPQHLLQQLLVSRVASLDRRFVVTPHATRLPSEISLLI